MTPPKSAPRLGILRFIVGFLSVGGFIAWVPAYFFSFIFSGFNKPPSVIGLVLLAEPFVFLPLCLLAALGILGPRMLHVVIGLAAIHAIALIWLLIQGALSTGGALVLPILGFVVLCLVMCRGMLRENVQPRAPEGPSLRSGP